MTWTTSSYGGIKHMVVPIDSVWKPPLINSNTANEQSIFGIQDSYFNVLYDRIVYWIVDEKLIFSCNIDTTYFSFDSQSCTFRVKPSGLAKFETEFTSSGSVLTNDYCSNSEWELLSSVITVDNTDGSHMDVTLKYKRRPLFLLVNLVLPITLLAV